MCTCTCTCAHTFTHTHTHPHTHTLTLTLTLTEEHPWSRTPSRWLHNLCLLLLLARQQRHRVRPRQLAVRGRLRLSGSFHQLRRALPHGPRLEPSLPRPHPVGAAAGGRGLPVLCLSPRGGVGRDRGLGPATLLDPVPVNPIPLLVPYTDTASCTIPVTQTWYHSTCTILVTIVLAWLHIIRFIVLVKNLRKNKVSQLKRITKTTLVLVLVNHN